MPGDTGEPIPTQMIDWKIVTIISVAAMVSFTLIIKTKAIVACFRSGANQYSLWGRFTSCGAFVSASSEPRVRKTAVPKMVDSIRMKSVDLTI